MSDFPMSTVGIDQKSARDMRFTGGIKVGVVLLLGILFSMLPKAFGQEGGASTNKSNVLFIAVDDLRSQHLRSGESRIVTPNIDRLADEGVRFLRHYVQVPTCGASRYSMLTSQRPNPSRPKTYGNEAFSLLSKQMPGRPVALPRHFRHHGYRTVSIGKISHSPDGRQHEKTTRPGTTDNLQAPPQMPKSWDKVYGPRGPWGTAWRAFFAYAGGTSRDRGNTPATEAADVSDLGYPDGRIAKMAVAELRELRGNAQPFFLAVGFYKPHLPFTAPQRYWDFYNRSELDLASNPAPPTGIDPSVSLHDSGELFGGYGGVVQDDSITQAEARTLRHGYYAAVSYTDAQIGKVLDALERLNLDENTVVVLWGDHGWHLGDLGVWGKHTTYEFALRSPLVVRAPDVSNAGGTTVRAIVESLDIYPTLADLCGLPIPGRVDGESLVPHLKQSAPRGRSGGTAFGYWRMHGRWARTMRTERYRLTRWTNKKGERVQVELYDHWLDPHETKNVADERPMVIRRMNELMHKAGQE